MSHLSKESRHNIIAQMSGEYIRAVLTNTNYPAHLIGDDYYRHKLARDCVTLAEEHANALNHAFSEPATENH